MADKNEMDAIIDQVYADLKEHGYVTRATSDRLKELEKAAKDFEAKMALGSKAVSSLADAGLAAAGAMYEGKKGAAAFNSSVDSMADAAMAAGAALTLMIPGGPIIKAFVAGMTLAVGGLAKVYKVSAEMADSLNTGFQKLSKSGGAASDGLTGIFGDLQKLGLGVQDLDGYVSMINDSSRDLALFGGSVFAGRKAFADIGKAMEPFREQLFNAGLTQEQINAGAMGYLKLQTRLGQAQTQTNQQLAEGAKKYLIEQDALTKLTGQSRQDREQEREAALSEQRFRAKVEEVRATQGEAAAERLIEANLLISSRSKEAGQAFRDLSTGMITTEAAQKGLISSNGELMRVSQAVIKGEMSAVEATQITGRSLGAFAKDMNMLAQAGVFNDIGIDFAQAVEMGLFANKDLAAELKKIKEDSKKQGVDGGKAQDKLQQAQTDLTKAQQMAMLATQKLASEGMLPATLAAIKMAGATESAATGLNNFLDGLTKMTKWLFGWLQGEEARAKTKEEIAADEKAAAAKAKYDKAFAGVPGGNMALREAGIGATAEQKAALEERKAAQAAAVQARKAADAKYGTTKESAAAAGMPSSGTAPPPAAAPSGSQPSTGTAPAPAAGGGTAGAGGGVTPTGQPNALNVDKLLNYIGQKEANGQYDMLVGRKQHGPLTSMTVAEVMEFQKKMISGQGPTGKHESTAVGKYQIIQETLAGLIRNGVLKPSDVFDSSTQDRAALGLLKEKGMDAYVSGKMSKDEFADRVARVWASMPLASGQSAAAGIGSNKALGTRAEYLAAFARDGGMFDGPMSGYPATLHGPEAVIPLKNGMVPVSINPTGLMNLMPSLEIDSDTADQISKSFKTGMNVDFGGIVNSLDGLVRQQQAQNNLGLQERMISLLEDIRSSQVSTANHTGRMAAVASN